MSSGKILFVLTSHDQLLNGKPTGWYLPEAAHPYYTLKPHYEIVFASPKGGEAPLDPSSVEMFKEDAESVKFLNDTEAQQKGYKNTIPLSQVDEKDYKAIFYVGGHGPVFDLAVDQTNIALATKFVSASKPVVSLCHGPGALVNVKDPKTNESIFKGRKATAFSDEEESQAGLTEAVPWLLESKLRELGAVYSKNEKAWGPKVEVDGNLITGANPASATETAKALLKVLGH